MTTQNATFQSIHRVMNNLFALCTCGLLLAGLPIRAQSQAARLLPFQGRLSDASGKPISDGARVVQFQIYSEPSGGNVLWAGEVHRATVNGGLVNVVLGTKNPLPRDRADQPDKSFFDQPLYLQITVDSNADNQITALDPPLLPRQAILPVVFVAESANARTLQGFDWSALFAGQSPVDGKIAGSRIAAGSIASEQIADASVTVGKLVEEVAAALCPSGTILPFGGDKVPNGWLLCDGRSLSAQEYPRLYSAIATNWGGGFSGAAGEVTKTGDFNLPDLRGVSLRGVNGTRNDAYADADFVSRTNLVATGHTGNFGNAVGTFQQDAFQGHYHQIRSPSAYGGTERFRAVNANVVGYNAHTDSDLFDFLWEFMAADLLSDRVHGEPRASSETRSRNASVHFIVKY